jgi:hypothetical protein
MTNWNDVNVSAPGLAERVKKRVEAHGLALLATIRSDGYPRVSGIEPLFADGELWLGMMPQSRKAVDLQRDPRLSLHSATADKEMTDGDAKITGRGIEVDDPPTLDAFARAFEAANGYFPPGPFHLFRVDVTELAFVKLGDNRLIIESWREGGHPTTVERT